MILLEAVPNIVFHSNIHTTYAIDYQDRYPFVYGEQLGILTDNKNTPLQSIESLQKNNTFDISTATGVYIAHFKTGRSLSGI